MNLRHRRARYTRSATVGFAAMLFAFSGCVDMLPSTQSVAYWTPDNILYRMQPTQLGRLNEFPHGLNTEAYYSISDDRECDPSAAIVNQAPNGQSTVIKPAD